MAVRGFGSSADAADFFAIGLRSGFDAVASAFAFGAGAATGLRRLFALSSFSCSVHEGFFKSIWDRGLFEKIYLNLVKI